MDIVIHVVKNGEKVIPIYVINSMPLIFQVSQAIEPIMNIKILVEVILVKNFAILHILSYKIMKFDEFGNKINK